MTHSYLILAGVLVVGLSLGACSGPSSSAGGPGPTSAPAGPSAEPRAASPSAGPATRSPSPNQSPVGGVTGPATTPKRVAALGVPPTGPVAVKAAFPQPTSIVEAAFVAVDNGFFAQNGLEVSLSQVEANAQVASLLAGEIPYAFTGAAQTANADLGGADLVMVATSADLPVFSLYAQPRFQTVQDLAGQTIGITSAGTATDAAARLFLRHYGLEGQVTVAPSGGSQPAILAAISQGLIAGGILAPPVTSVAARQGLRELVNGTSLGVPMNITGLVLSRRYIHDHTDEVRRFLTAYQQAWTFCADPANQAAVVAAIAKYTQSPLEDARTGYEAMRPVIASRAVPSEDVEAVRNVLTVSPNPQVAKTDPSTLVDNSILESLPAVP